MLSRLRRWLEVGQASRSGENTACQENGWDRFLSDSRWLEVGRTRGHLKTGRVRLRPSFIPVSPAHTTEPRPPRKQVLKYALVAVEDAARRENG